MAKEEQRRSGQGNVCLVTGATSPLGVAVVKKLVENGNEVRVVIRDRPELNPEWKTLPTGVKPYVVDLSDNGEQSVKILRDACKDASFIFHFASINQTVSNKFSQVVQINVVGTENLLRACLEANYGKANPIRVIYSSSTAVYGYHRKGEILTEDSKTIPVTPYAESKLMGEQVIKAFATANPRLKYTILRIGVIYGRGYNNPFNLIFKMLAEGKIKTIGSGTNYLSLVHVDDVVDAIMLSMNEKKAMNKLYNLTDGMKYTQKELLEEAAGFMKIEAPQGNVSTMLVKLMSISKSLNTSQLNFLTSDRVVSIDKIKRELGFAPSKSIEVEGEIMVSEFMKRHRMVVKE